MTTASSTIPLNELTAIYESNQSKRPRTKKRILVADDSPQIRESIGRLLRTTGYDVSFAAHGGHVLDQVLNADIDLLLLDLNMPQMDGWDALYHIADMKPTLPVIVITAQPNQREWVMSGGGHALMEKPLDLPLLLQTIEEFLREPPIATNDDNSSSRPRERFRHGWPRRMGPSTNESPPHAGIND